MATGPVRSRPVAAARPAAPARPDVARPATSGPVDGRGRPISLTASRFERPTVIRTRDLSPAAAGAQQSIRQHAANVRELRQHIGQPDFYNRMARMDPRSAGQWNEMAEVQARFHRGEPGYDPRTRVYSESMRESLHRAAIGLYQQMPPGQVYGHFVAIHPALFHANGALRTNGLAVLGNTDLRMVRNVPGLIDGGVMHMQDYQRLANQAAEQTRVARERRGLPITAR